MAGIKDEGYAPPREPLDRLADRLAVQTQIDDGCGVCRRFRGSNSAGGGVRSSHCGTCRREGLLQIKSDKWLVFNDENVLTLKHSSA
jgi:hypothetical protein